MFAAENKTKTRKRARELAKKRAARVKVHTLF